MYPHLTQLQTQRHEALDRLERRRLTHRPRAARRQISLFAWPGRRRREAAPAPC
jgi:hypothetical protein